MLYEHRKEVVPMRLYWHQVRNSKVRGHMPPQYTKEELIAWVYDQPNYNCLYDDWESSGFVSDLRPSCDRLDNSIGYTFKNIELVTWGENKRRANEDTRAGKLGSSHVPVYQYDLNGTFIAKYHSITEASRQVKRADHGNISNACKGILVQHARFQWRYTMEVLEPVIVKEDYYRPIYQYDVITGELLDVYPTIKFIDETQFDLMKIRSVIQGVYSTHNKNYWSFEFMEPSVVLKTVNTKYVAKTILQLDLEDNIINTFKSMSEASRATNTRNGNISKCCNGKAKTAGGFKWKRQ